MESLNFGRSKKRSSTSFETNKPEEIELNEALIGNKNNPSGNNYVMLPRWQCWSLIVIVSIALALGITAIVLAGVSIGNSSRGLHRTVEGENKSPCAGTTLQDATKTVIGEHKQIDTYDWNVLKSTQTPQLNISHGECGNLVYDVSATRFLDTSVSKFAISGSISVQNGGEVPTEGLVVADYLEVKSGCTSGGFVFFQGPFIVDISSNPVLDANETGIYNYEFVVANVDPTCHYRNVANITIINHSGWTQNCPANCPGGGFCPFGTQVRSDGFQFPAQPTIEEIHENAKITDIVSVFVGFTHTPAGDILLSSSNFCQSTGGDFVQCVLIEEVCNTDALCDSYFTVSDYIQLMSVNESPPITRHSNTVEVELYTGICNGGGGNGCSLTIGYWKTHAGFHGNNADRVSQYLPIQLGSTIPHGFHVTTPAQSTLILSFNGDASNGLNKLAAQLLAAKYNILNGANGSAIASYIITADSLLGTHGVSRTTWDSLPKNVKRNIIKTMNKLDQYNNGEIGPGHCN